MLPYKNYYYPMDRSLNEKYSIYSKLNSEKQKPKDSAKKHAVAEQWRRWRINGHYRKLREFLHPNMTSKMVKASILTETVRHVKELKKRAVEAGLHQDKEGWFRGGFTTSLFSMFPGECDEVAMCSNKSNLVKATVCCEDRQGLNRDLREAIRVSGGVPVKVDMAVIGGRTVVEVVVRWPEGGGGEEEVRSLRRALKALVDNRDLGCNELGQLLGINGNRGLGLERPTNNLVMVGGSFNDNCEWENVLSYLQSTNA